MLHSLVFLALTLAATIADDDEVRVEQLIHGSVAVSKPSAGATRHSGKAADAATVWLGRNVRVHTIDQGLYIGTLQALDADKITLRIALAKRALLYTLPRNAVARMEPVDEVTP